MTFDVWFAVYGAVLGLIIYGIIRLGWDDSHRWSPRFCRMLLCGVVLAGAVTNATLGSALMRSVREQVAAETAAYEASLTKVTVTVTDVESVPNAQNVCVLVGFLILSEEFPRQKIFIPLGREKKISVGDFLDLTLDGWNVVEAKHALTEPIPAEYVQ